MCVKKGEALALRTEKEEEEENVFAVNGAADGGRRLSSPPLALSLMEGC